MARPRRAAGLSSVVWSVKLTEEEESTLQAKATARKLTQANLVRAWIADPSDALVIALSEADRTSLQSAILHLKDDAELVRRVVRMVDISKSGDLIPRMPAIDVAVSELVLDGDLDGLERLAAVVSDGIDVARRRAPKPLTDNEIAEKVKAHLRTCRAPEAEDDVVIALLDPNHLFANGELPAWYLKRDERLRALLVSMAAAGEVDRDKHGRYALSARTVPCPVSQCSARAGEACKGGPHPQRLEHARRQLALAPVSHVRRSPPKLTQTDIDDIAERLAGPTGFLMDRTVKGCPKEEILDALADDDQEEREKVEIVLEQLVASKGVEYLPGTQCYRVEPEPELGPYADELAPCPLAWWDIDRLAKETGVTTVIKAAYDRVGHLDPRRVWRAVLLLRAGSPGAEATRQDLREALASFGDDAADVAIQCLLGRGELERVDGVKGSAKERLRKRLDRATKETVDVERGRLRDYSATIMDRALARLGVKLELHPRRAKGGAAPEAWVYRAAVKLLACYRESGAELHACARCGGLAPLGLPTCPYCGESGGTFPYTAWEAPAAPVLERAPIPTADEVIVFLKEKPATMRDFERRWPRVPFGSISIVLATLFKEKRIGMDKVTRCYTLAEQMPRPAPRAKPAREQRAAR